MFPMSISFVEIYTTNVCGPGKNAQYDALILRKTTIFELAGLQPLPFKIPDEDISSLKK